MSRIDYFSAARWRKVKTLHRPTIYARIARWKSRAGRIPWFDWIVPLPRPISPAAAYDVVMSGIETAYRSGRIPTHVLMCARDWRRFRSELILAKVVSRSSSGDRFLGLPLVLVCPPQKVGIRSLKARDVVTLLREAIVRAA